MLGDGNVDDFNIRELCRRADVSSRTIYNAFGSRESVIALAIHDFFEAFQSSMTFDREADTFEGALQRQIVATLRNLQIPNYLRATAPLYFSPTIDRRIHSVLLGIGQRPWRPWLEALKVRRGLEKGSDIERLTTDLSDLHFSKACHWAVGALSDDELLDATLQGVLTLLAGATRGDARVSLRAAVAAQAERSSEWLAQVAAAAKCIERHWMSSRPASEPGA